MRSLELVNLAWRNLRRRKSRTALTVLSMVIGAVAIILMLSFGYAVQENQRQQLEDFAQLNAIQVSPAYSGPMQGGQNSSQKGLLTDKEVRKIEKIAHVKFVLPSSFVEYSVELDAKEQYTLGASVKAIDFARLDSENTQLEKGHIPNKTREDPYLVGSGVSVFRVDTRHEDLTMENDFDWSKAKVVLPYEWQGENQGISLGQRKVKSIPLTYAGTISSSDVVDNYGLYISFDTLDKLREERRKLELANPELGLSSAPESIAQNSQRKRRQYDQATVVLDDVQYTHNVINEIQDGMGLNAYSNSEIVDQMNQATQIVQAIFAGIGSISLLVSAIGIANTMLMSIHERMREIGVMKVIGAQVGDIRRMFLIESALIGVIGGTIGVLLSYLLSAGMNHFANQFFMEQGLSDGSLISIIPFWLPFVAFIFSALIGIIAGYLPANRATRISAIEAIRTE